MSHAMSNHSREPNPRCGSSNGSSSSSAISSKASAGQPVRGRQRSDHMHRVQQPAFEARRARRRNAEMNLAAFEPAEQPSAAILDQVHLHAGMAAPVADQKRREQVLDHLRCRGDPAEFRFRRS